jgi:hypothetical protein
VRVRCCDLVLVLECLKLVPRCTGPLESSWLVGKSSTLRLGVERQDDFVQGMRRPLLRGSSVVMAASR